MRKLVAFLATAGLLVGGSYSGVQLKVALAGLGSTASSTQGTSASSKHTNKLTVATATSTKSATKKGTAKGTNSTPSGAEAASKPSGAKVQGASRGSFGTFCGYSHSAMDDPIMDPGMPGAAHMHDFYGNTGTDAYSTPQTLLGGSTTCSDSLDASGYWAPATFMNGVQVTPIRVESWYFGSVGSVVALPANLEFIAGDQHATTFQDKRVVNYSCGQGATFYTSSSATPYDCTPYVLLGQSEGVVETINFPSCWDGKLSTGDDSMHFAYRLKGSPDCPAGFPTTVAQLSVRVFTGI